MKKILIFWLWFQAQKYVKYFENKWYEIESVTKSGINKNTVRNISKLYKSEEILKNKNFDFSNYDMIILSIHPYNEQEKVIKYFLENNFLGKIIVEKPVSYNENLIKILENKRNFYFFVDELFFSNFYKKIGKFSLNFILYNNNLNEYIHLLEHIFWWFLLSENFENILQNLKIKFLQNKNEKDLKYNIIFDKNILFFEKWDLFLNNKKILTTNFSKSLDFILQISDEENILYKKNFYLMRKFINALQPNPTHNHGL